MTGERAKRFPLGLEDLVREPRRPEGRPGEMRAAAIAASAALNTRQSSTKQTQGGAGRTQARASTGAQNSQAARSQVIPQAKAQSGAAASAAIPPKPQAAPVARPSATSGNGPAGTSARQAVKQTPKSSVKPPVKSGKPATHARGPGARASSSPLQPQAQPAVKSAPRVSDRGATPNTALGGLMSTTMNSAANNALALTSERVRERMVERLRANGVTDQRVLNAMAAVPRHLFVDPGLAAQAYEDAALPIGHHQTISKPSVVARMIELAAAGRELNNVLEIGTGCGYQAAVLSRVAREVYSIERIKPLSERAKTNLRPLRIPNIRLHYGDGRLGLPSAAPFDAIVIAAAGLDVPQALLEQLAIGGRLVAPVGSQEGQSQVLTLVERVGPAQWRESRLDRVFFVPLKSGVI
ncbi:protein-L-isoaspartate(D-aspartate) O-methyltransferase [Paraburkholderia sp. ZP32-5]|uniref:protein-L-isoaspartate(D-aspartate) O-methyltransferase n=1 Tax=Paraburkholderia sp. ZP32-5 TaxID=2883245 RepID=UPI001F3C5A47|nr:protein-L-isoaspartate(D-aspartate) O-methyltransferase [Paraburkholderia sp. ZP32-5]